MFTVRSKKGADGAQKQPKAQRSKQEIDADKLAKARRSLLRTVGDTGTEPNAPSNFFMPHNKDYYHVNIGQVVSCKMPPGELDASLGHRNRDCKRRLFWINCGQSTASNQDVGKLLHGTWKAGDDEGTMELTPWPFALLHTEEFSFRFVDPPAHDPKGRRAGEDEAAEDASVTFRDPTRVPDPARDVLVGTTAMYSIADVAGRYGGHKALCTPSTTAWTTLVLGLDTDYRTGKPNTAPKPVAGTTTEAEDALYGSQRELVKKVLTRLYLVYPAEVDGCFDAEGRVFPKGELDQAKREGREPKPIVYDNEDEEARCAPQPVQFVSIVSDKREGAPGLNVAGVHDATRAWPLLPGHVEQLKKILAYYELEAEYPALANLHAKRNSAMLDLELHRQRFITEIGDAPERPYTRDQPVSREWLKKRAAMPFGKVWVQKFDEHQPNGCVKHGTSEPILVPLLKNRAQCRNGTPWLDVERIDRSTPSGEEHYIDVQIMLHRIVGKAWNKASSSAAAASGGAGNDAKRKRTHTHTHSGGALVVRNGGDLPSMMMMNGGVPKDEAIELLSSFQEASADASGLRKRVGALETALAQATAENKKLKMAVPHMVLNRPGTRRGLVDFVKGRDAKCILRWSAGTCQLDAGNGKTITLPSSANMVTIRYMASEEPNLPAMPMLDDDDGRMQVDEEEEEGEGGSDDDDDDCAEDHDI